MEASYVQPNSHVFGWILASYRGRGEWQESFQVLRRYRVVESGKTQKASFLGFKSFYIYRNAPKYLLYLPKKKKPAVSVQIVDHVQTVFKACPRLRTLEFWSIYAT